ncbi:MAG: DUF5112 domain-containing protein, partial [Prevotellaceae bacterium]|nr:DUF5112 domain-containing protein [Prevotellaceae bacterium]
MKPLGYGLFLRASLPALWIASALCSCVNLAPAGEVRRLDSLNHLSYTWRYKDLDQAVRTARQAYHAVTLYTQGKAEAANALAFCAFMKMDFEGARAYYKEVYSLTQNELELLIADVGMMKVCQRMALNKSFYDYRNSAIRRMKRIDEDQNLFLERHERRRLIYARSEFQIVSAVYYYYLQQRPQAVEAINRVEVDQLLPDTNQLLYYHYIRAASQLCDGATAEERRVAEFDELFTTYRTASHGDYLYFEGNAAQGLANLLLSPATFAYLQHRRSHALNQLAPVDSLLPFRLGQQALASFQRYGDRYQIAGAYVTIGRYLNRHGSYRAALDTLSRALACVNDSVNTVPECVSRIREQLSVTYAGLGDKTNSDYNRNIYLDILEETRQDRELESRYQALQDEISRLNMITWGVIGGFFLVGLLFWYINKRGKKREGAYLEELRGLIHHAFSDWEQANERTALTLTEQRKQLEKQRYIYQQHITEGKRQNILKKVCLSIVQGMTPYIDRIVREVHKLALTPDVPQRAERYQYIDELTTTINEYNDVLSQWIQLKQGTVRLH